ncbi:MAG: glucose-6-phosphate isomerase [Deltaproteobacteria bacterium]|nr:glucose-6-phosphate isomerase [Deltaproteobacteria bacterium]MBI4223650.1 glucose-6-phosphate isomerase [Deltaproteobacteria bacterium]
MISFDFSKCSLKDSEMEALSKEVAKARATLKKERESGAVGFWALPFDEDLLIRCRNVAKDIRYRFQNLIVLGIGGSSVGLRALSRALWPSDNRLRLLIQESPDPQSVEKILKAIDLNRTCINVISKSGATIETTTLLDHFLTALKDKVGEKWRDHVVVTTEQNKGKLFGLVEKEKLIHFEIPENVDGRFSVFSAVGLFPLTCIGVNTQKLLKGAARAVDNHDNACRNGTIHYLLNKNHGKTISVMMTYGDALKEFGGWYAQLWAESLGKEGKGQTPLACQGPQDQHSLAQLFLDGPKDKVVTFIKVAPQRGDKLGELMERECNATAQACFESGCPSVTITLPSLDEETLGELLMTHQIQTAFTGHLMGINPYDQPAVERIKKFI